ncbi:CRISPR-associated endoribonuclease Cas6 [Clostridium diolis]|uniref:CRISPR-associated endoribonuclease Cas6 n=1 Tax=Clostridium diolis TaxID=223919 RepID=A0AAV3W1F5_9CLOT|nr:CRISPR-associated endoribonuclease Cas6 [Clostridium diolis]QES74231.1 CRISPR-associated endoribonuclease Cas6 [Clostridium diolis]GEA30789.1 CRISPR-associated endoribonuclease Cas6 [Clostridium diolis]
MKVFEILLKVYLLEDIELNDSQNKILKLIDKTLGQDERTLELHNKNDFKNYCFNSFYPLEKDGIYKEGNIYTITIRTVDKYLATYLNNKLANSYTYSIKGLKADLRIIPIKKLKKIYSITPLVIKNDDGYWKNLISFEDFERRLKENLIKKHNNIFQEKINEDFKLYDSIELKNNKPIGTPYKDKTLLGDKISIDISEDDISQDLAYMALGVGMGEMNARGFGFMGYRWV